MGLDVYMSRCDDWPRALASEETFTEITDVNGYWGDDDRAEKLIAVNRQIEERIGAGFTVDEWGSSSLIEETRKPSELYPDHLFSIGYFRSSYNEGGIDRVMSRLMGDEYTLGALMGETENERFEGYADHDWAACLKRIRKAIVDLDAASDRLRYDVITCDAFNPLLGKIVERDKKAALAIFHEQRATPMWGKDDWGSYSNRDGEFFPSGTILLRAAIQGSGILGNPAVHMIIETEGPHESYRQSLEIMAETCEWVLAQPKPETYRMYWSG